MTQTLNFLGVALALALFFLAAPTHATDASVVEPKAVEKPVAKDDKPRVIPEPGVIALFIIGGLMIMRKRRR